MARLVGTGKFISLRDLKAGYIIDFMYESDRKYALVLNPEWDGKLHALKIERFDTDSLLDLLKEIGEISESTLLYEKFKNSEYVENRGYRTYVLGKMTMVRRVFLAEENK